MLIIFLCPSLILWNLFIREIDIEKKLRNYEVKKNSIEDELKKEQSRHSLKKGKKPSTQGNIDDDNVDIDLRVTVPDNEDGVDFQIETSGSKNDDDDDDDVIYVNYNP